MTRTLPLLFGIGLAATAALVALHTAHAAELDPGLAFYEKEAKAVLRACGEKIWLAADEARKGGLYRFCKEQAERALDFDPDQKDARDYLCFVKRGGKWVQDDEKAAKIPPQNVRPENRSEQAHAKFEKKWTESSLEPANRFCAARYAELGDLCAAKGHGEQATKAYEAALRLDKENERARKGLGYTKFGKVWLTRKQDEARKAASKAEVVQEEEPTVWEDLFGKKLNKVESRHFRFESPYDVPELTGYAQAVETAYAYYLADFGRDPDDDVLDGSRALFVVVENDEQWNKAVDEHGGKDKEFTRQLAGMGVGRLGHVVRSKAQSNVESRRDLIVHSTVHMLNARVWRLDARAWLDEGLAYYYTLKVIDTCLAHCVGKSVKTRNEYGTPSVEEEGGLKKWDEPENWKPLLKEMVRKKDDMPLRSLMSLPLTKLEFQATVKAWSVASWLMDLDRDRFTSVLEELRDPAARQEMVFQDAYGKGLEALDEEWRAYALRAY